MTILGLLADVGIATAITKTAQMFWLPQETVVAIVRMGLPALSRLAAVNPLLVARLYAVSREQLPEPIDRFYASMAKSPVVRQATMDDYRATYGEMLDSVNRAVGRQAGTTDGQAREVLAALLPAICHVLGRTNTNGESGFAQRLQELGA